MKRRFEKSIRKVTFLVTDSKSVPGFKEELWSEELL